MEEVDEIPSIHLKIYFDKKKYEERESFMSHQ